MVGNPIVQPADLDLYQAGDPQTLIDQATAVVRRYCGWHVTPSITETVTVSGSGTTVLLLPTLNITAVASVTVDGVALAAETYTWSPFGLIRKAPDYYDYPYRWWDRSPVTVVMTHGYAEAPDLAAVIMARVSRVQTNPEAATRIQTGPFADQYEAGSGFTAEELCTLDRYRLPPRI